MLFPTCLSHLCSERKLINRSQIYHSFPLWSVHFVYCLWNLSIFLTLYSPICSSKRLTALHLASEIHGTACLSVRTSVSSTSPLCISMSHSGVIPYLGFSTGSWVSKYILRLFIMLQWSAKLPFTLPQRGFHESRVDVLRENWKHFGRFSRSTDFSISQQKVNLKQSEVHACIQCWFRSL